MKKFEDLEFFWVFSSAGTAHIARDGYPPKYYNKFCSLCKLVRKEKTGLESPIEMTGLDSVPEGKDVCQKCKEEYERKRDATRVIHIPIKAAEDVIDCLQGEDLDEDRAAEIVEELNRRIG